MGKIKSSTCVVCDAGPVIHLSELATLNILNDFQRVIIPGSVHDEILKHTPFSLDINIKVVRDIPRMEDSL
jgi:hypothetical protein